MSLVFLADVDLTLRFVFHSSLHPMPRRFAALDRAYTFPVCSPTRGSFMTGRLPFHANQVNRRNCDPSQGPPKEMTFISQKLANAGYKTAHVGKWHLGMASRTQIPQGRGFDDSLLYFEGAEDHWTQRTCCDPECLVPINATNCDTSVAFPNSSFTESPFDLWKDDGPATELAGTQYNGYMFNDFAVDVIQKHDVSSPLFMYLAPANSHAPLEAPQRFLDLYPSDWYLDRRQYAAMCSFWDEIAGNVTRALQAKSMWDQTLFVFSSDNGGPAYWSVVPSFQHGAGANNWPLKGSKASNWEGGIRVVSFVAGGALPLAMRGKTTEGYIHIADWYATFCEIGGCDGASDASAAAADLPAIDSLSMWPLISGQNNTSPRVEIAVVVNAEKRNQSVLIVGDWKLLTGVQLLSYWQGPEFPNASNYGKITDPKNMQLCTPACLYNIRSDPTEQKNVALGNLGKVKEMLARLDELKETHFNQIVANGNFFGSFLP